MKKNQKLLEKIVLRTTNKRSSFMKKFLKTFFLGILAGFAIGLGSFAFVMTKVYGTHVMASFAFSIGLLLVCFLSLNLYTGKIGFAIDGPKENVINLLPIYFGNIVGAVVSGYLFFFATKNYSGVMDMAKAVVAAREIGDADPWYRCLILSSLCGVFVFLAVYGFKKFQNPGMKAFAIIVCVFIFVVTGMEHTIANMVYFSFANAWSWNACLNILLTTIGNSLGAILAYLSIKVVQQ